MDITPATDFKGTGCRLIIRALGVFENRKLKQDVRDDIKRKLHKWVLLPEERIKQKIVKLVEKKLEGAGREKDLEEFAAALQAESNLKELFTNFLYRKQSRNTQQNPVFLLSGLQSPGPTPVFTSPYSAPQSEDSNDSDDLSSSSESKKIDTSKLSLEEYLNVLYRGEAVFNTNTYPNGLTGMICKAASTGSVPKDTGAITTGIVTENSTATTNAITIPSMASSIAHGSTSSSAPNSSSMLVTYIVAATNFAKHGNTREKS